jgi:predicted short-subunit dehydrogenase-like oxidoreductase (DUF2520 family)
MTRIGVVGAGRVGAVLAAALRSAGHVVTAVSGASPASRTRIETLLPGVPVAPPSAVARDCDLLLLTVPDDALGDVVDGLVADGAVGPGQYVVHTSGRHGRAVLGSAAARGAHVAAMHPVLTFTGTDVDLTRLPGCVFGVTATSSARRMVHDLVADLGGTSNEIPEEHRTLYHAGVAHGANHLVTLVAQAADLLRAAGAADPAATLRALLSAALDNVLDYGDAALTGPVVRGDVDTVRAHLAGIADTAPPALDSYVSLARATAALAERDGRLQPARAVALRHVLDDAPAAPRTVDA